jgi:hypothetical protein
MRPPTFSSDSLRKLLLHDKIATLPDLKRALGTEVDLTVFRKLKELDYLTSYSHRGRFYTLREVVRFGVDGLWSCDPAWFSRYGTLLATAEAFIRSSAAGYFAEELSAILHVATQDVLRQLVQQNRIARELISGLFLYTAIDSATRQRQRLTRRSSRSIPTVVDASRLEVPPDEMRAAIILFYSLLDEQQRRLYAGLESMKLGHGGDSVLAEFLGLDPHAIARGRRQLLDRDVEVDRTRQSGAGRKAVEKNARSNRGHRNPTGTRHRRRPPSPAFAGPTRRLPESLNCYGNSISRFRPIL